VKAEDIDYLICGDGRVKLTIPGYPAFEDEPAAEEPLEHRRFECPCGEIHDDEWSLLAALSHALAEDRANEHRVNEQRAREAEKAEAPPLLFNQATYTAPASLWNWKWFWIAAGCAAAALFLLRLL
jgi:hypothetical protein